jgi:hypothetical protein
VTRLGEFSTLGPVFYFSCSPNIWATFFRRTKVYVLILAIKRLGYILGDGFAKSSGHTADESRGNEAAGKILLSFENILVLSRYVGKQVQIFFFF